MNKHKNTHELVNKNQNTLPKDMQENILPQDVLIDVYSCGIGHMQYLHDLDFARYHAVFASASLLETYVKKHPQAFSIGIKAHDDAKNVISLALQGKKIAVLSSGDALYHGFGASLAKQATLQNCAHLIKFHPNITAFQALFHKIGMEWNNVQLFSAHHGKGLPLREIISCNMPLIYGGSKYPAHLLAQEIIQFNSSYAEKQGVMAEFLGNDVSSAKILESEFSGTEIPSMGALGGRKRERIIQGKLSDLAREVFSPTSTLLILPCQPKQVPEQNNNEQEKVQSTTHNYEQSPQSMQAEQSHTDEYLRTQILPLGLPEHVFAKENNLITASDTRAIILSRLRLPLRGHFWDLGAGSGSVGLEAAALRPQLHVHAIEQKEDRISLIEINKKALGIVNYTTYYAKITEKIAELETPQRIFIGGGGKNLPQIMDMCAQKLSSNGIIVASAVTLESFHTLSTWKEIYKVKRTACLRVNIAHESTIAGDYHHFKDQNTLYIFTYTKD